MQQHMAAVSQVYHPVGQADLEHLLDGAPFLVVKGQLIFRSGGEWVITGIHPGLHVTAGEYRNLPEGAPYQLVCNELVFMPSPFELHQLVVGNLHILLTAFVRQRKLGAVRISPLDVYLDEGNVVQPDLMFIRESRRHILAKHVLGAPDLVVEVLSRATEALDRGPKREAYARHGVQEYWIIDPEQRTAEVYGQEAGVLTLVERYTEGPIRSRLLEGFEADMSELFEA